MTGALLLVTGRVPVTFLRIYGLYGFYLCLTGVTLWYLTCTPPELRFSSTIGEGASEVQVTLA